MRLYSIAAAGLAVSANAFLLPPEISSSDSDIINILPVEATKAAQSSSLKLNCPGCPVSIKGKEIADGIASFETTTEIPSHLQLDFEIDSTANFDRLLLNGFELYPKADPLHQTLVAPLVPDVEQQSQKTQDSLFTLTQLGFGLHVQNVAKNQEDLLELVQLELQIIEIGNVFINGIESVQIKMIKTPDGKLMIRDIGIATAQKSHKSPMDKQADCTTFLCKWRAMLMSQIARLRSQKQCPGRKGHGAHGHVQVDADGTHHLPGHHRPQGFGQGHHGHHRPHKFGHGHHGHRGHKHSWGQLFKNIASHILLPVAVGIIAGVSVSIIGMMAGTFIVFVWRTFFRPASRRHHRRRAGSCHKAAQREAVTVDEKAGLMAHQEEVEAPPMYVEEGITMSEEIKPQNKA